ncbi:MAG: hypothetical protein RL088_2514 [Verrucomicrobiota bacterium]|jgi:undecaprenyl-diphosphatase
MSTWLIAIVLGLVEGLTEFIPVSSTGHLLIVEHLLGVERVEGGAFFNGEFFNAIVQCGAVLAALPLFKDRLATLKRWREPAYRDYFLKLAAAFGITAIGGLALKKAGLELPESVAPIAAALAVGGVLFVMVERWIRGRPEVTEISWKLALLIGAAQLCAVAFPGTSRSGVTILAALMLGLGRGPATEFSFLLGVPTLLAAGALKTLHLVNHPEPVLWGPLVVACVVAAISSILAVKWMLGYVRTHTFTGFGIYRIALAALLLALYATGIVH